MVGTDPSACPPGWIFVDINNCPPNTQSILDQLKRGRGSWPKKDNTDKRSKKDSQTLFNLIVAYHGEHVQYDLLNYDPGICPKCKKVTDETCCEDLVPLSSLLCYKGK